MESRFGGAFELIHIGHQVVIDSTHNLHRSHCTFD